MNTFRIVSRVVVATVVVLVSGASAQQYGADGAKFAYSKKFTVMGHMVNNQFAKHDYITRAAVDTAGYAADKVCNSKEGSLEVVDAKDLLMHLGTNYAIRVASDEFGKKVCTVKTVAQKGEKLSQGMVSASTVETVLNVATQPEVLILLGGFLAKSAAEYKGGSSK